MAMRLPRPRFSLRSLILLVLLLASGMGLWWRWEPWVKVKELKVEIPDGAYVVSKEADSRVSYVLPSPSGRYVLIKTMWQIFVWEPMHGPITYLKTEKENNECDFTQDETRVLVRQGLKGNIYSIDLGSGKTQTLFQAPPSEDLRTYVSFEADRVLVCDWRKQQGTLYSISNGARIANMKAMLGVFGPDGSELFTAVYGEEGTVWDAKTGEKRYEISFPDGFLLDGFMGFTQGLFMMQSTEKRRMIWDASTWKPFYDTSTTKGEMFLPRVSKDRQWVVSVSSIDPKGLFIHNVSKDEINFAKNSDQISAVAFSIAPSGDRCIALTSEKSGHLGTATIFDLRSGREVWNYAPHGLCNTCGFLNSEHLYVASPFGPIEIFSNRRPEHWWGLAWLPEFWLAVVFSLGLGWSLWRDRKPIEPTGNP